MKLFLYYSVHSIKNQLKKLFKTWVAVFVVVMVAVAIITGALGAIFEPEQDPVTEDAAESVVQELDGESLIATVELAAAGVVLVIILLSMYNADKSGSRIFNMADVNLLFSSPMKPQSVLLFKLSTQLGLILLGSFYLLFQLPNLVLNLGVGLLPALSLLGAWLLALIFGKLINVLIYTVASTSPKLKSLVLPFTLAIPVIIAASFLIYFRLGELSAFDAADAFFNAPFTRYIPIVGWTKGIVVFAFAGNYLGLVLSIAACAVGIVLLSYIIWHIKADFYEDAMAKSAETAEVMAQVQSGKRNSATVRKKDRSEKLRRDGLVRGAGANIYFFKEMYNRFRFAYFGFLTKTTVVYLLLAAALSAVLEYSVDFPHLFVPALALGVLAFFRTLGNPIQQDTKTDYFVLIPESPYAKVFWSMFAGTVNCVLDVLPAMVVSCIILRANPLEALAWIVFIATVDFYSTNVGLFLDLSIPVNAGKTLKSTIQIFFIYFGLIFDVILVIAGFLSDYPALFIGISALVNIAIGLIFFAVNPTFVLNGKK